MIVSVGGTPGPIVYSLNEMKPDYVIFFASKETKGMIQNEILPNLSFKPQHYNWILTGNAENLSDCHSELLRKLPEFLEQWGVDPRNVCVDYTGGTKTMSVALALATIEKSCCFSYIGGQERTKGGVGIVIDGNERKWFLDNPWDQIALTERREACILFNKARYRSVAEVLGRCVDRVSREQKPVFKALYNMVVGYELWDRFSHKKAKDELNKSRDMLSAYSLGTGKKEVKSLARRVDENIQFLENLTSGEKPSRLYYYDLLANAKRRGDLELKFDDAVARLYRAMEMLGQVELKEAFGINTSEIRPSEIPETIREEFTAKYQEQRTGKIRLGLYASYRLLKEKGTELGEKFFRLYDVEIRTLLERRNSSILAHGLIPVSEEAYKQMFDFVLSLSRTRVGDLPIFPELKI
jgi:CRISPR-associated protein (TIGR02710 family)